MKRRATNQGSGRQSSARYARAANVIGRAYRAYRNYRNRSGQPSTRSKPAKNGRMLGGITTYQKDYKNTYKYKRAPNRLRKKWKKSKQRFTSNLLKNLSSRKYHLTGNQVWASGQGGQNMFGITLYGVAGTGGADGTGDLQHIWNCLDIENRNKGTESDQVEGGLLSRRLYMDEARLRAVLTNTGGTPVFWEIYTCVARKDIPYSIGSIQEFLGECQSSNHQGTLSQAAGQAGVSDPTRGISATFLPGRTASGVTPFEYRFFCQNWKILKVTRMQCSPGNTVTFDAKKRQNRVINWDDFRNLGAKKGITILYLVRQWGTVENISGVPTNSASNCVIEVERDYNVKLLDTHLPQLNYATYTSVNP